MSRRLLFALIFVVAIFAANAASMGKCGTHEVYVTCGMACEPTCTHPYIRTCSYECKLGCECEQGYLRNAIGACVPPDLC